MSAADNNMLLNSFTQTQTTHGETSVYVDGAAIVIIAAGVIVVLLGLLSAVLVTIFLLKR